MDWNVLSFASSNACERFPYVLEIIVAARILSYSTVLLRYLMDTVELSKLIVAPPAVTFIGIDVAFRGTEFMVISLL